MESIFSFRDQKVVVFGGSSGIGFATAKLLVQLQAEEVMIVGRNAEKLSIAEKALSALGTQTRVSYGCVDLTEESSVQEFYANFQDKSLNHIVVTAGSSARLGNLVVNRRSAAEMKHQFDIKFFAQMAVVLNGHEKLVDGGSFVIFSGILAQRPGHGNTALGAANAALEGAVKGLANDLGFARKIRINCISPAFTDTPAYSRMDPQAKEAYMQKNKDSSPLGRVGQAEEIASSVIHALLNPNMTGQVLINDSGSLVRP